MRLVPDDFEVPEALETGRFRLRMLTIHDVEADYEAVMSSVDHLKTIWNTTWPEGLTLEQNLIDLGWHHKEFQRRTSFAYTAVAPDESRVLGCVYIYPPSREGFDAEVYLWARADEPANGLEAELEDTVKSWLDERWPFERVAFPGRDMTWREWGRLEPA